MAKTRTLQRSFAGGEIAPEMVGRLDLDKFQTGLKTCRNFETLPHGPAQNRAGFRYILEAKDSTNNVRLIPFSFNNEQTYVLEFGHLYVRFHSGAATLLESVKNITAISQANPGSFTSAGHGYSDGDWVYVLGCGGMNSLNFRFYIVDNAAANTYTLTDLAGVPVDTSALAAYTGGGTTGRVYTIASPYTSDHLFDIHYAQSNDVLTLVHPSYAPRELNRTGATTFTLTTPTFSPTIVAPGSVVATPTGAGAKPYSYKVTTLGAGLEESLASAAGACTNDLTVVPNKNVITWAAVTGATRYNVYKQTNGLYGYIGQTDALTFDDDNILPDLATTPPEGTTNPFNAVGDYPSAVSYWEQRRVFAATDNRPQNVWMTRPTTESNFTSSIPTRDDDAIFYRIKANQQNRIRHMIPMSDMLMLTTGAEWRLTTENSDVVTPATVSMKPQSFIGASNVTPVVAVSAVLFIQSRGSHLRELRYSWEENSYKPADASIMAPHMFRSYTIKDMAFTSAPYQMLWAVRSDGVLLGFTYVPEHRVTAWHTHDTDGLFKSVAAVAEGNEDALYAVIERTVSGRTVKYIERKASREVNEVQDSFFVDGGLTYSGAAATIITGLWHLEGKQVAILTDGAVHPRRTVANGQITLEQPAELVHIGLPITADMETLPLTVEAAAAMGRGMSKNIGRVFLGVDRSSIFKVGPAADKLREAKIRTTEPYGSPPALRTGEVEVSVDPVWSQSGGLVVRQENPLPLTVLSLALEVEVNA